MSSTFRYFHLKVAAKKLPGKFRIDPLAVVFVGAPGAWQEKGRTEKRLNEWNPSFAQSVEIPADSDAERRAQIRVDFYNKEMRDDRFIGTCEVGFHALIDAQGRDVELVLQTPFPTAGHPRVFLSALEGYTSMSMEDSPTIRLSFQLMQTNYYGVSMRVFYEICRAGNGGWHPVHKGETIRLDEQGWGQFPTTTLSLKQLTQDEDATPLLVNLYHYRRLGSKKLLGHFQCSVKDLNRMNAGDFLPFTPNLREDIMSADVQVMHSSKAGSIYDFGLKLINVVWRAEQITPENTLG